jgi:hypothetical protein
MEVILICVPPYNSLISNNISVNGVVGGAEAAEFWRRWWNIIESGFLISYGFHDRHIAPNSNENLASDP